MSNNLQFLFADSIGEEKHCQRMALGLAKTMNKHSNELPVIEDCRDCGVCCFHMGYPAFMLPRSGMNENQIKHDPEARALLQTGWTEQELLVGHPGENHWHNLPHDLKAEWKDFVAAYNKTGELDEKCFWLDNETKLCKHHQYRPQVCRDFETGCTECRQWRRHFEVDGSNTTIR